MMIKTKAKAAAAAAWQQCGGGGGSAVGSAAGTAAASLAAAVAAWKKCGVGGGSSTVAAAAAVRQRRPAWRQRRPACRQWRQLGSSTTSAATAAWQEMQRQHGSNGGTAALRRWQQQHGIGRGDSSGGSVAGSAAAAGEGRGGVCWLWLGCVHCLQANPLGVCRNYYVAGKTSNRLKKSSYPGIFSSWGGRVKRTGICAIVAEAVMFPHVPSPPPLWLWGCPLAWMNHFVLMCLNVTQSVSKCPNVSQSVSMSLNVSQCVSMCLKLSQRVSKCLKVSQSVSGGGTVVISLCV